MHGSNPLLPGSVLLDFGPIGSGRPVREVLKDFGPIGQGRPEKAVSALQATARVFVPGVREPSYAPVRTRLGDGIDLLVVEARALAQLEEGVRKRERDMERELALKEEAEVRKREIAASVAAAVEKHMPALEAAIRGCLEKLAARK